MGSGVKREGRLNERHLQPMTAALKKEMTGVAMTQGTAEICSVKSAGTPGHDFSRV